MMINLSRSFFRLSRRHFPLGDDLHVPDQGFGVSLDRPQRRLDFIFRRESLVVPGGMVQLVQELEHLDLAGQGVDGALDRVQNQFAQSLGGNVLGEGKVVEIITEFVTKPQNRA